MCARIIRQQVLVESLHTGVLQPDQIEGITQTQGDLWIATNGGALVFGAVGAANGRRWGAYGTANTHHYLYRLIGGTCTAVGCSLPPSEAAATAKSRHIAHPGLLPPVWPADTQRAGFSPP